MLTNDHLTYRCECSRKSLAELLPVEFTSQPTCYPGICRDKSLSAEVSHAIRVKTEDNDIAFLDGLQSEVVSNLAKQYGDFILRRKDGIIAYQLAVVIDDNLQQVNHVVRGCDLLQETPKQIYLQRLLGLEMPHYLHVPVIIGGKGYKLSKQTLATAVDTQLPNKTLFDLLMLLKQNPPNELAGAAVDELLDWGISHWRPEALWLCSTLST